MPSPESKLSDGCIIDQVLSGKPEQFEVIVCRYHGPLLHLALGKLGRLDAAEEAVQETFFHAYKSLHTYDSQYSFRTWLWTILINQCRRQLKKGQSRSWLVESSAIAKEGSDAADGLAQVECRGPGPQESAAQSRSIPCRVDSANQGGAANTGDPRG